MGALGDRVGRRRLLLAGAVGFAAASLLAAFARSPAMLIAARALLGVAGATLMPSTLSLIRAMFADSRQRTTAFGVWTASLALGGVIAPVVAGLLLARFWRGSVFLVAVPVVAVLLALGPALLPEVRARARTLSTRPARSSASPPCSARCSGSSGPCRWARTFRRARRLLPGWCSRRRSCAASAAKRTRGALPSSSGA